MDEAADILPWTAANYGRVDKSVALGLKARLALYAGSWCKFGFGMDGEKDQAKATEYFKIAAAASKKVIDEVDVIWLLIMQICLHGQDN